MDASMQMYAVLYSKFSPASQRFLALLENLPKMRSQTTLVCVDNRQARQRVMSHAKLPVQEVPCVIRIFADTGYTELFEGEQAFALVKNMLLDEKPRSPVITPEIVTVTQSVPSNTSMLPGPKLPQQMSVQQHMQSVEMATPIVAAPLPVVIPPSNSNVGDSNYIQIPKNPVPTFDEIPSKPPSNTGASTAYLQEIEKENMQRGVPERSLKSNSVGGSITLRAQQMQKEREAEMGSAGPGIRGGG